MEKFDERQVLVRGRIMTQSFVLVLALLLVSAFINDMGIYDIEKNIGFSDYAIDLICIAMTYASCSLILRDAYIGLILPKRAVYIMWVFILLSAVLVFLNILHLLEGEPVTLNSVITLIMVISIASSLFSKRNSWG